MVSGRLTAVIPLPIEQTLSFIQPPRLLSVTSSSTNVNAPAIYHFTIALPMTAGKPLERLVFKQISGSETIEFSPRRVQVFTGERRQPDRSVTVQATVEARTGAVFVTLNPPIPPGTSITVALRPIRNPSADGIYLIEVTAFSAGEGSHGQFLGFGRFQFYQSGEE
jgi:hypothetical protein